MSSDVPTFNLKAVVRETGLKPDTIRAWERRYGVPKPPRTTGGHRLYSQRDIDLLKWMNARQQEGLSISRTVDLWKSLEAEGADPLQVTSRSTVEAPRLDSAVEFAQLQRDWVEACLKFDEARAEQLMAQAFAMFPLESVITNLLLHGLAQVGEGWYRGEVAVQQEHFISALVMRRLQAMIASSPLPTRAERIVVACPPEEQHTLSLQVINLFLRRQGWEVVDLGANVPLDRLEFALADLHPQLMISAAQHLPTAQTLQSMASSVAKLHIPFGFGGYVFNHHPNLRRHVAGHFLGEDLSEISRMVEHILHAPWPLPEMIETPRDYLTALDHYHDRLTGIEADVMDALDSKSRELTLHAEVHGIFAQYIMAALALGDLNFLDVDLNWIRGLLVARHLPDEVLRLYLRAYWTAAQKNLDRRAHMVVAWLEQTIEKFAE